MKYVMKDTKYQDIFFCFFAFGGKARAKRGRGGAKALFKEKREEMK